VASQPIRTSSRLGFVKPSVTLAVTAKAAELKAKGVDVVSFGAGEPDFDTPDHIKAAARAALDRGVGKYTHVAGTVELRKAIAAELGKVHGVEYGVDQILVSTGAKHSLYNLFVAMLDEGDEVLIPAPYWVSYPDMVLLAGGKPVVVETSAARGFALEIDRVRAAITPKTRAIILNTPSNPTGATYDRATLEAVAKLAVERDLLVVSDDIYRSLVYGDTKYVSIASLSPEVAARTMVVDGVSKAYAMTGWRIGYAAGPRDLIAAMTKLQGQSTSNPTAISQAATLAALTGPQDCVETMRRAFDERRRAMAGLLRAIPKVSLVEPTGAFYCFPDVSAYVGKTTPGGQKLADDIALTDWLVEDGKVAVVPGSGFGAPGFVRLSYACSMADIEKGVARLGAALTSLR
jgi:aspartate aminotransferase